MSLIEHNTERDLAAAAEEKNSTADDQLFPLPSENSSNEIETQAPIDNAAPIEEIPETNFEFSSFNIKETKKPLAQRFPVESVGETMRKTGLAWSAAIVFFGSVVFMLVLGWFFDLIFGSSPWGIVLGIVVGSLIGFLQFFRITSQIINPPKSEFDQTSIKAAHSDLNSDSSPKY